MKLREYQLSLVEAVRHEVAKGKKRILMVLPTGGGKSFIIGDIANKAIEKGNKVLALMHRRQLVTQLTGFLEKSGVSPAMIMSGEESDLSSYAQVATCQTYLRRLKLHPIEENHWFIPAEVVFIDEAHHALSKTYQKILKNYEEKIVIGVTATPVLSSGVGMGEYFDSLVSLTTVQDLIDEGHLVPSECYGPSEPDLSKLKTVAGDYEKKGLGKLMNEPKIIGDVVDNWFNIAGGLQTMVFAVNVKHSKALRDAFIRRGVSAEHLDAHADDETRSDVLRRFDDGDTQVVSNVGLYTEGTDIPSIECIVLARPTKSIGLHLQMIGRGARPYPGKEKFIILDHGGNINRLGFYEDAIEWTLDGKKLGYRQKVVRKLEKKIRVCPECTFQHTGPKCPQCGYTIPDWGKMIKAEEAELIKLSQPKGDATMEDKKRFYGMLMYYQRDKGYSEGWIAHKYKAKFKCWPKMMSSVGPIKPDLACLRWLKYQNIKWAKSKRKAELDEKRKTEPASVLFGVA